MQVDSNGVIINVEVYGPDDGTPVLLLHGFPDSSRLWSKQIGPLTDAGFRLIVPDQRGYGRSDKPATVADYDMVLLATDQVAVLDQLGVAQTQLVGHDWGAAVAWAIASLAPDRVDHLVALSVGHPTAFRSAGFEQREKSWYMLLFQFEDIAEQWLTADGWANFREWSRHPDADAVIADLEANGSLTPGLNWYRAALHPRSWIEPPIELPKVKVPTMGVWSTGDFALIERQMTGSAESVEAPWRYERLDGPGHWMQWEDPQRVNSLLLDFLTT